MENTTENNKLIAEFMGVKIVKRNNEDAVYMFKDAAFPEYFRCTQYNTYNSDWRELMPVVEKINNMFIQGMPQIRIYNRVEAAYSPLNSEGDKELKLWKNWEDFNINSVYEAVLIIINWMKEHNN